MLINNENNIDVSVIVPMYNVESLIEETIHCLKKNNCSLEVILIDDGSSDDTLSFAYEAVNNDSRFIIISQKNQGVSAARNKGLQLAKGEYITFVDSDDLTPISAIDLLFSAAIEKDSDFVYGTMLRKNKKESWMTTSHRNSGIFREGYKSIISNPELFYSIGPCGKLIKRDLLEDVRFPIGIDFAEDQVVTFTILVSAKKIYCIDKVVYYYRERDTEEVSASATQEREKYAYQYILDVLSVIDINISIIRSMPKYSDSTKNQILSSYLDRVITYEVWPLLLRVLKFHSEKIETVFDALRFFLKNCDRNLINNTPAFRYFFIRCLLDNIFYIRGIKSFLGYRTFLDSLFDKFNNDVYRYFSKPTDYGNRWDNSYQIAKSSLIASYTRFLFLRPKKKFFYFFNREKVSYIKKYCFPLFKILPKNKYKIIFSTSKNKPMGTNFEFVLNEIKKKQDSNKYKIYKFLGPTKKTSTLLLRYFHAATAKTIFLEDYYNPYYGLNFSSKTNIVQLWHACGAFKKFAHDAVGHLDANTSEFENNAHSFYTHVITSSENINQNYSDAFYKNIKNIEALGVPRTDIFFDAKKMARVKISILEKYPFLVKTRNILYAPTFRGGPAERKEFNLPIDWEKFKALPLSYKLIIKLHPVVEKITPEIPDWIKNRVMILDSKENVNDWMIFCDTLITDYSSLIFEYSLLNKPIIYFPYDLDSYFDERGFYYSYENYVYGDVVYTTDGLIHAILSAELKKVIYKERKNNFKNKFMNQCDGKSSERIIDKFIRNI